MKHTGLSDEIALRIGTPRSCLKVSIPVRRDDGTLDFFTGYCVRYAGGYKGTCSYFSNSKPH